MMVEAVVASGSVRARAQRSCACVVGSAANLLLASTWGERGFRGAANEQPASLELDARVTYLPEYSYARATLQDAHAPAVAVVIVVFYFYH